MTEMTPQEIDELLADERIGRLCMADREGRPYAIPLPFCWDEGALYVRLPLSGRKGDILRENNRVCFEVDRYSDTFDDYASVLIEGRLELVEDLAEKQRVSARNTAKYERLRRGHRPGHGRSTPLEQLQMRKLIVERISGRKKDPPAPVEQFRYAEAR